ncbi:GIY-YIG nuclease family protein [Candidatus Falkowbacteria bacterium]|jgi:putative endonuclease|nr:GIY-YIG nuclease family protein [Candidatus Falkowbacteria bacterium]
MRLGYLYILASKRNGTLYIGVTSNLEQRVWQHKNKTFPDSFTSRYGVYNLVWYDRFDDIRSAIYREKQIKKWKRSWKIKLIEEENPNWNDLSADWI